LTGSSGETRTVATAAGLELALGGGGEGEAGGSAGALARAAERVVGVSLPTGLSWDPVGSAGVWLQAERLAAREAVAKATRPRVIRVRGL
jgi:hypothetical protein